MKTKPVGRPKKYPHLLMKLEDDIVYSAAGVFHNAVKFGILSDEQKENLDRTRIKIRHTLSRLASNNKFPPTGDGLVNMPGQPFTPGWEGRRWKSVLCDDDIERGNDILGSLGVL